MIFNSMKVFIFIFVHFLNLFVHAKSLGRSILRTLLYINSTVEDCFEIVDIHVEFSVQDLILILITHDSQEHGTNQCLHCYYRKDEDQGFPETNVKDYLVKCAQGATH